MNRVLPLLIRFGFGLFHLLDLVVELTLLSELAMPCSEESTGWLELFPVQERAVILAALPILEVFAHLGLLHL